VQCNALDITKTLRSNSIFLNINRTLSSKTAANIFSSLLLIKMTQTSTTTAVNNIYGMYRTLYCRFGCYYVRIMAITICSVCGAKNHHGHAIFHLPTVMNGHTQFLWLLWSLYKKCAIFFNNWYPNFAMTEITLKFYRTLRNMSPIRRYAVKYGAYVLGSHTCDTSNNSKIRSKN